MPSTIWLALKFFAAVRLNFGSWRLAVEIDLHFVAGAHDRHVVPGVDATASVRPADQRLTVVEEQLVARRALDAADAQMISRLRVGRAGRARAAEEIARDRRRVRLAQIARVVEPQFERVVGRAVAIGNVAVSRSSPGALSMPEKLAALLSPSKPGRAGARGPSAPRVTPL